MSELDLGAIRVVLVPIPTGKGEEPDSSAPPQMEQVDTPSAAIDRGVRSPDFVPAGLRFLKATLVNSPVSVAVSAYHDKDTGRSFTLAQTPLDQLPTQDAEKPTVFAPGIDLEEVRIGLVKGARVTISTNPQWQGARYSLVWLKGESVYQLSGRRLEDDEVANIASSV